MKLKRKEETRQEQIERWEREGFLDPDCSLCEEFYASKRKPSEVFAPSHKSNSWCESGKRPHCTCDACF